MAWSSLSNRLAVLPQVLAGPILRKVTPDSVTVWLALKSAASVTLQVFDDTNTKRMEGTRHTCAIGKNLHIVAVTAVKVSGLGPLTEGVIYQYDGFFDFDSAIFGHGVTLAAATNAAAPLAYLPATRPSFCLPPADISALRLIHGSCRHPNGQGKDALAYVDQLIHLTAGVAAERPHQLLMAGDQIYADDVAASLLVMLSDAASVLLGWNETLPFPAFLGGPAPGSALPPFRRFSVARYAGFTSDTLDSHLMTLGEYICMYLFVWSDVLWDASIVPTRDDVMALVLTDPIIRKFPVAASRATRKSSMIDADRANLLVFREKLSDVRRVLANIPTYMILDDHDVTDDFNMTRSIATGTYKRPLGRRVVQNALVAYSLCQHWGNVPEQFSATNSALAGTQLLATLDNGDSAAYDANSAKLQGLVGVHNDKAVMSHPGTPGNFHDTVSLRYNYTIEGPGHQIIVTDTRTWRDYPNGAEGSPELLPASELAQQITNTPALGNRALLVVLTTNMPPVPVIRFSTEHPHLVNAVEYFPDIFEAWDLPSDPFDRLVKAITDKLPLVGGVRRGQAIVLSGDVHSSFASRLLFTATSRFEDPQNAGQPALAVIAQLVASSFRNQDKNTNSQHRVGYDYPIFEHMPEGYVGWNVPSGAAKDVYLIAHPIGGEIPKQFIDRPTTVRCFLGRSPTIAVLVQPDYGYRFDYLGANVENTFVPVNFIMAPFTSATSPADRQASARRFLSISGDYRTYNVKNTKREIVGVNNVGEVTFDWGTGDSKRVNLTTRWFDPDPAVGGMTFSTYAVSLNPADPSFTFAQVAPTRASGVPGGPIVP